jgi:hypothetical protein
MLKKQKKATESVAYSRVTERKSSGNAAKRSQAPQNKNKYGGFEND